MQSRNFRASVKLTTQAAYLLVFTLITLNPAEAANKNYRLPVTSTTHMAYAASTGARNGLPATTMDSFVANALKANRGDEIYGDEGIGDAPPPFFGFTANHRINAGIVGQQDAGLTTGHGSYLPDAWGRDEFLGGQEWSQGGRNFNAYSTISSPDIQVVASYDMPSVAPSFRNQSLNNAGATAGGASANSTALNSASSISLDSGF